MFYRPSDGKLVKLGKFFIRANTTGEFRCDLHPGWSRDGKYVCIDSMHSDDTRQMYVLDVSGVVGDSSFREFPKIPRSSIRRENRTPKTSTESAIVDCGAFSKAKFPHGISKSCCSEFLESPLRRNDVRSSRFQWEFEGSGRGVCADCVKRKDAFPRIHLLARTRWSVSLP
jgi:hypothetical protein